MGRFRLVRVCTKHVVYTDGSKNNESVHSALFDPSMNFKQSFRLDNNCSVFTAESYDVLKALHYISSVKNYKKFLILTDSLSLIHSLDKLEFRYKKNFIIYAIREALYYLKIKYNIIVKFKWIPSHSKIIGNEIVDDIAKRGINEVDIRSSTKVPIADKVAVE
jgi:ribonuclease HI